MCRWNEARGGAARGTAGVWQCRAAQGAKHGSGWFSPGDGDTGSSLCGATACTEPWVYCGHHAYAGVEYRGQQCDLQCDRCGAAEIAALSSGGPVGAAVSFQRCLSAISIESLGFS